MKITRLIAADLVATGGLACEFKPGFGVRMEYENYGPLGEQNGSGRANATLVPGSGIVRF